MLLNSAPLNDSALNTIGDDSELTLSLVITGGTPTASIVVPINLTASAPADIVLTGNTPDSPLVVPINLTPAQLALVLTGQSPLFGYLPIEKPVISTRRYRATLTGAPDGLPDLEFPISTITGRLTNYDISALTVVCPDGGGYSAAIAARPNGKLIIDSIETYTDGSEATSSTPAYNIDTLRADRGPRSWSVTLRATKTLTLSQPRRFYPLGVSYIADGANGKRRIRCELDKDFLPGDIAVLSDGSEIITTVVTYVIGAANRFMEIGE